MFRNIVMAAAAAVVLWGCGPQQTALPDPRPLIIRSGSRLRAEPDRMAEIDNWVRIQLDSINVDPSFWVITESADDAALLWDSLHISNDSATIQVQPVSNEVSRAYMIYAHLHLMKHLDRADVWVSEAPGAEGLDYEKAVLRRVSDLWFYARSIFDAIPYEPLDELLYSNENGFLDAYIFTMRPGEFPEEQAAFQEANPTALDDYLEWFRETFRRLPTSNRIGSGP